MSLINQVLKDLEKRRATGTDAGGLPGAVRPLPEERRSRSLPRSGAALLVIALGGTAVWWLGLRQEAPAAKLAPPASVVQSSAAATAPVAPAPVLASLAAQPTMAPTPPVGQIEQVVPEPPQPVSPTPALASLAAQPTVAPTPAAAQPEQKSPEPSHPKPVREPARKTKSKAAAPALLSPAAARAGDRETAVALARPARDEPAVIADEPVSIDKQARWTPAHERAEGEFKHGMRLFHEGRPSEAETAWRGALETDPANQNARQALLGSLLERGQREEAERLIQEGLIANPSQPKLSMVLARLQLERGAQAEALRTLEAGLADSMSSGEYLSMTAAVMARAGRHREAAALYEAAVTIDPRNAVWYMGLGMALRADARPADALAAFQRARDFKSLTPELQAFVERQARELQ